MAAPTTHGTAMIAAIAAAQRESRWLSSLALTRGTIQVGIRFSQHTGVQRDPGTMPINLGQEVHPPTRPARACNESAVDTALGLMMTRGFCAGGRRGLPAMD